MAGEFNHLELLPEDGESLAAYIRRIRELRKMTRTQLAKTAAVNVSTITRLENGISGEKKPRKQVQERIGKALKLPIEYIQSLVQGEPVIVPQTNKVCLKCWVPGSPPDIRWSEIDAKFCLKCGAGLRDECDRCREPILLRGKFCPGCGLPYR